MGFNEWKDPHDAAARGLADSLRGLARQYQGDGRQIEFRVERIEEVERIPASIFTACYCICREALDNAVRHSGARRIALEVAVRHSRLIVRVTDDGRGFDGEAASKGVARMEEHARLAGARLDVRSAPDAGTCISFVFALPEVSPP